MLNEKHESGTARRIESGIARRGSSMSQAWPDEALQAYSSQAWPDRYFKTSSQKVQQYGRVRHSPTDALKQIHKNCKHMAELGMAQPKRNYFVCRSSHAVALPIILSADALAYKRASPWQSAQAARCQLAQLDTAVPPQFRMRS